MSEAIRPFVPSLLELATGLLDTENEPNTILCIKIIIDLYKNTRPAAMEHVGRFLGFVQRVFVEFPKTAAAAFGGSPHAAAAAAAAATTTTSTSQGAAAASASAATVTAGGAETTANTGTEADGTDTSSATAPAVTATEAEDGGVVAAASSVNASAGGDTTVTAAATAEEVDSTAAAAAAAATTGTEAMDTNADTTSTVETKDDNTAAALATTTVKQEQQEGLQEAAAVEQEQEQQQEKMDEEMDEGEQEVEPKTPAELVRHRALSLATAEAKLLSCRFDTQRVSLALQEAKTHMQKMLANLHSAHRTHGEASLQVSALDAAVRTQTGQDALTQQRARLAEAQSRLSNALQHHGIVNQEHQQAVARHSQLTQKMTSMQAALAAAEAETEAARTAAADARAAMAKANRPRKGKKAEATAKAEVDDEEAAAIEAARETAGEPETGTLLGGINSFKVLTECPIVVVLLFQLYNDKSKDFVRGTLPQLMPLTINVLSYAPNMLRTPAFKAQHKLLVAAQVKTLSFLAYVLNRGFVDVLRNHKELPSIVMQLLKHAPADSVAIRKELLIATRHILASDLRSGFVSQIDLLMDERVLIGDGWTCREMLRPLAYSTLADLVHHIRQEISTPQLCRAAYLFLRNIQDNSLPLTIQTMSCKLILNLVEVLARKNDAIGSTRRTLLHILSGFTAKLGSLANWQLPRVIAHYKQRAAEAKAKLEKKEEEETKTKKDSVAEKSKDEASGAMDTKPDEATATGADGDAASATSAAAAAGAAAQPMDEAEDTTTETTETAEAKVQQHADDATKAAIVDAGYEFAACLGVEWQPLRSRHFTDFHIDSVKDLRFLIKTLTGGLKTIIWGIANCNHVAQAANAGQPARPRLLAPDEVFLLVLLLRNGLGCFEVYGLNLDGSIRNLQGSATNSVKPSQEESECISSFAALFTMIDVVTFREIFKANIGHLVNKIIDNNLLLAFPQHLLSNRQVSTFFAPSLLKHLIEILPELGTDSHNVPMATLRLFKLIFGSVSLFPSLNEVVLQPQLSRIVHRSMELSTTSREPYNYLLLLRALFRSIGGGKFEALYREVLPLLPTLLNGLTRLQEGAHHEKMRDLFVELCLTVPVRLSALLPYLHYLMRPLVLALNSGNELVGQGLRTLELCIDNLTPEFLDPVIDPVRSELMQALWQHLKPVTQGKDKHGLTALRVLGKLGGRNRCMLKEMPTLKPANPRGSALRLTLPFSNTGPEEVPVAAAGAPTPLPRKREIKVPVDNAIREAASIIISDASIDDRRQAFYFLRTCLVAMLDLKHGSGGLGATLARCSVEVKPNADLRLYAGTHIKREAMEGDANYVLRAVLRALFAAAADASLASETRPFAQGIVRHFVLVGTRRHPDLPALAPTAHPVVDEVAVAEAIAECLCSEKAPLGDLMLELLHTFVATAVAVIGDLAEACRLPLFSALAHEICACCYKREWYCKRGGVRGIAFLVENMPQPWVVARQVKLNKALLFAIVDLSNNVGSNVVAEARALSVILVRKCCADGPWDLTREIVLAPGSAAMAVAASATGAPAGPPVQRVDTPLGKTMKLLASELSSPDGQVRDHVVDLLNIVSDLSGLAPAALLANTTLRDTLIPKTGRNTPVNTQIGRISALTYALTIEPPLVEFEPSPTGPNDQPTNSNTTYFAEVSQICRLDDNTARQAARPNSPFSPQMIISLRHKGLSLLGAAQRTGAWSSFAKQTAEIFVRNLESTHTEIVDAALNGLQGMDVTNSLPKEDLESVLRILMDKLSDYRKLSVPLMQALGRLVGVVPSYFSERVSDKLFEHLMQWLHRVTEEVASVNPMWRDSDSVLVATAIVKVLPTLGKSTVKLMDPLVENVLTTETLLGHQMNSAFRVPLFGFFNAFPERALSYLLERISSTAHARLLCDALAAEDSEPLREQAYNATPQLLGIFDLIEEEDSGAEQAKRDVIGRIATSQVVFSLLPILRILADKRPDYLRDNAVLVQRILALWRTDHFQARLRQQELVPATRVSEPVLVAKLFIDYLAVEPDDVDVLLAVIDIFSYRTLTDVSFLWRYFYGRLAARSDVAIRRRLLFKLLEILPLEAYPEALKVQALEKLTLPLLCTALKAGEAAELMAAQKPVFRVDFPTQLSKTLLGPSEVVYGDDLRMILLQLVTAVLQGARDHENVREMLTPLRESYFNWAWNYTFLGRFGWSLDDTSVKQAGCIVVCLIAEIFEDLREAQVLNMVYERLLAASAAEARQLVRQGIAIMASLLANLPEETTWVATTERAIRSEVHMQCQHAWGILVRQESAYYPHRHTLVRHVIDSLVRLGQQSNSQLDVRKLAVDVVEMIVLWETRAAEEAKKEGYEKTNGQGAGAGAVAASETETAEAAAASAEASALSLFLPSGTSTSDIASSNTASALPRASQEMLVTFLIHTAIQVVDRPSSGNLGEVLARRCLDCLSRVLTEKLWPRANVSVSRFDNLLLKAPVDPQPNQNFASFYTALRILSLVVANVPKMVALHKIGQLRQGLTKVSQCRHTKVALAFRELLERVLVLYPRGTVVAVPSGNPQMDGIVARLNELYRQIHNNIVEGLASYDRGTGTNTSLYVALMLLTVFSRSQPTLINEFTAVIVRVVQRLQKDHLSSPATEQRNVQWLQKDDPAAPTAAASESGTPPQMADNSLNLLAMCFELLAPQLRAIEQAPRKQFFSSITALLEKSQSPALMHMLVTMIGKWATAAASPEKKGILTIKDLASLMYKAQSGFTRRFSHEPVFNTFLTVLLRIFSEPGLRNSDLTQRLENGFMMGMRARDMTMRERFFAGFDYPNKDATLHDRLDYVFNEKCAKWDTSKTAFWVKHCLDVVMAGVRVDAPIAPSSSVCRVRPLVPANHIDAVCERPVVEASAGGADTLGTLLQAHAAWLAPLSEIRAGSLCTNLRTLCHARPQLAYALWIEIFPLVWQILSDSERLSVGQSLRNLLQQDYHHDQATLRPNNVNALVTGVSRCTQPMLALPATLLYHLSKTHGLWHTGIHMLYHQQLRAEARGEKVSDGKLEPIKDTLADLYLQLHEDDMWFGMWRLRAKLQNTTEALAWEQQGYWQQAQRCYEDVIRSAQTGGLHSAQKGTMMRSAQTDTMILRDAEFRLWEERWQGCSARLGQDELMVKYGSEVKNYPATLQAACNLRQWKQLKDTLLKLENQREPKVELRIFRTCHIIATAEEQSLSQVEKMCQEASQLALRKWMALPGPVSYAHVPLLQTFQRIVELEESAVLLHKLQPTASNATRLASQELKQEVVKLRFKFWL
eukprot:UC1_evm1s66